MQTKEKSSKKADPKVTSSTWSFKEAQKKFSEILQRSRETAPQKNNRHNQRGIVLQGALSR